MTSGFQPLNRSQKLPKINKKIVHIDALKFFSRLIFLAQEDVTFQTSLEYELTAVPLSLFSNIDLEMNKTTGIFFLIQA